MENLKNSQFIIHKQENKSSIFAIFIFLILLWPKYTSIHFGIQLNPYNIIVIFCFFIISFSFAKSVSGVRNIPASGYRMFLICLLIAAMLSKLTSDMLSADRMTSLYNTMRDFAWVVSPFIIGLTLSGGAPRLRSNIVLIAICTALITTIAIFEFLSKSLISTLIIKYIPVDIDPAFEAMVTNDKTREGVFRAQSLFIHPLMLGGFLAGYIPVAAAGALQSRGFYRFLFMLTGLMSAIVIPMTGTRSSLVAAVIGACVFVGLAILGAKSPRIKVFGALLLMVATPIASVLIFNYAVELRAGGTAAEAQSSNWRKLQWAKAEASINAHPLFGTGDGSSIEIAGIKVGQDKRGRTVDDFYLTQIVDFGFIYVLLYSLFILATCATPILLRYDPAVNPLPAGLAAGIAAILVSQKASSIRDGATILFLYAGLLCGLWRNTRAVPVRR